MSDQVALILGIVVGFLAVVIGLIIFIARQPNTFRVHRSHLVEADPAKVFPLINNLRSWTDWSPFEKLDPKVTKTYSDQTSGPGAWYSWSGNNKAGAGKMTIVENRPNQEIKMSLEFTRPFQCNNNVVFTLEPGEAGTLVTWSMDGTNTFFSKFFHLVMNMDRMVGGSFEEGLVNLDRLAQNKL
jgi:hypothetical protein